MDLVTRLLFIGENSIGKTGLLIRSLRSAKPQSNSRKLSNWFKKFKDEERGKKNSFSAAAHRNFSPKYFKEACRLYFRLG